MPRIGEVACAADIGKKSSPWNKFRWSACESCKAERWTQLSKWQSGGCRLCPRCSYAVRGRERSGEKNPMWRGGRYADPAGYVHVKLDRDDPLLAMAKPNGYALEHRIVVARHIGRRLTRSEVVHHKNGVKDDNRVENLELTAPGKHIKDHHKGYRHGYSAGYRDGRSKLIAELRARIAELERGAL